MAELSLEAKVENLDQVTAFVESQLEKYECPIKTMMQITVAVEEIFVNVANYAYSPQAGPVKIRMSVEEEPRQAVLVFIDEGRPYNPLEKEDPDVTLSAAEREIGGLGIFMVKKTMDNITYAHENGSNVLKLIKKF